MIFPFDPNEEGLKRWFGPREAQILDYLWSCGEPRTLSQIHFSCGQAEGRTNTTIQVTLKRLIHKGMLRYIERFHGYGQYEPVESRAAFEACQQAAIYESLNHDQR